MECPSLIAVVDDDASMCRALERLLRSAGFNVLTFTDGRTFLRFSESRRPDCVVLDLQMPQMTGFDVLANLNQAKHGVPVVTITGHDTPESYQCVKDAGAAAYLCKPVDDQVLIDTVVAAIAKAKP